MLRRFNFTDRIRISRKDVRIAIRKENEKLFLEADLTQGLVFRTEGLVRWPFFTKQPAGSRPDPVFANKRSTRENPLADMLINIVAVDGRKIVDAESVLS